MNVWIILVIAGLLECAWAYGLKMSNGLTDIKWTVFFIVTLALSMILLGYTLKELPIGTAYVIWTGIGAVGTAALGMILFNEPKDIARIIYILLIVGGILGLKFSSAS